VSPVADSSVNALKFACDNLGINLC